MRKLYHWPEDGEYRWQQYFAWFPVAVKNEVIWLSSYWVKERYQRHHGDIRNYSDGFWYEVKE